MVDLNLEKNLLQKYDYVVGIDEVGRGCLAGPVVTAGFFVHKDNFIDLENEVYKGVDDSKVVSAKKRIKLEALLKTLEYYVAEQSADNIDQNGINESILNCILNTVENFKSKHPGSTFIVLLDGYFKRKFDFDSQMVIDGDAKHFSIAAASILAKVYRDNLMVQMSEVYPQYGFEKHVGYGTKKHIEALKEFGATPIHRKSFKPVSDFVRVQH